jgi:drug/metabolite transporter (DMT)-like permease
MFFMSLSSLNSVQDQGLSTNKQALGFLLIVLSELFGALSFTISKLTPRTPPLTLAYLKVSLIFAVASISIGFQMLTTPSYLVSLASLLLDPLTIIYFFLIATLDLSVNFLIFYTFRSESASMVASVNFLCVVWSIIIDVTVLGYRVKSWLEVFGGLIVLVSTSAIVFVKKL